MDTQIVIDIMGEGFKVGLMLALPVMLAALVVGVLVSIVQAITSVQEQTMVFVPKIIAVIVTLIVLFSWMASKVMVFTTQLFESIPGLVR